MEQAKRNTDLFFPVVGVLEELSKIFSVGSGLTSFSFTDTTLALLEHKLPSFFAGASHLFYDQLKGLISNYIVNSSKHQTEYSIIKPAPCSEPHRNRNPKKPEITKSARKELGRRLAMEKVNLIFLFWFLLFLFY